MTQHPVINLMEGQKNITHKGGTMRLGNWKCQIDKNSAVYKAYGEEMIEERHRHRYEFNNEYLEAFEKENFMAVGTNPDTALVEIDRKSTRLNSSHVAISYAVFCLKKK